MKKDYLGKKTRGFKGFLNRYFRTSDYCREYSSHGKDMDEVRRKFRRDRNIVRGITMPSALAIAATSYFTSPAKEWTKILGHNAKGYFSCTAGQMLAEKRVRGWKKYLTGILTSLGAALAWESAQEANYFKGNFNAVDMGYDSLGGMLAIGVENFFDRKLALVDLYEDDVQ